MNVISAEGFRALLENVPDGFFVHDETGRLLDLSERCCMDLGYSREELLGMSILDISGGVGRDENLEQWRRASPGDAMSYRDVAIGKDGSTFPVEIRLTCQMVDGQKLFLGVALDVVDGAPGDGGEARVAQLVDERTADLRAAHERLIIAASVGGLGIWDYDIVRDRMQCDQQWHRIMGRDPDHPIRSIADFRACIHPDDVERATDVDGAVRQQYADNANYGVLFRIIRPDGEVRWVRSAASIAAGDDGTLVRAVGFVVDVTDLQQATAHLEQQTREDPLTGVANRRHFDEAFRKVCLHAKRTGEPLTLAMIDIDYFKSYNDEHGHVAGDEALKAVAGILSALARRPYDLVARYGGDEFLLLLPGLAEPETILAGIGEALARLGIGHPASPVMPYLTATCGCVVAMDMADVDPLELLRQCDQMLYRAKEGGRNRVLVGEIALGNSRITRI